MHAPEHIDRAWFEARLSALRLTQKEMARRMGLAPSALSRALSGARHFKAAEIGQIAAILQVSEAELLDRIVDRKTRTHPGRPAFPAADAGMGAMEEQAAFTERPGMKHKDEDYIVPPRGADPLFGCLAGSLTLVPGVDYAAPADADWANVYDD